MTGDPEFGGRPLAVGTVRGVRSFAVDTDGWLRGVTFQQTWWPGENHAACCTDDIAGSIARFTHHVRGGGAVPVEVRDPEFSPRPPHGLDECGHGFYAYYDGSNDFGRTDRVVAVVEGYGETVIGTRGFRSMKARILALHIPDQTDVEKGTRPGVVQTRAKRRLKPWPAALWAGLAVLDAALGVAKAIEGDAFLTVVYLGTAVIAAGLAWHEARRPGPGSAYTVKVTLDSTQRRALPDDVLARMRARYPGVPVYDTEAELLAAFPPDRHHAADAA